jgi:hypothetical protein
MVSDIVDLCESNESMKSVLIRRWHPSLNHLMDAVATDGQYMTAMPDGF